MSGEWSDGEYRVIKNTGEQAESLGSIAINTCVQYMMESRS